MLQHLPILLVVLPLLAAPICSLLPTGRAPWWLATGVSWLALLIAAFLFAQIQRAGVMVYAIGGWPAPWGIEYRLDAVNALVQLLVASIMAVVLPFAGLSVERELDHDRLGLFYAVVLLLFAGLMGICATGDAFNVFVFLEIASLSSYALIAMGRDRRALTAAFRYLIMGTLGATFYLIGIGLLYALTGTLNMQDLAARLPEVAATRTAHTAVAFVVVGLSLKLALFPLHLWLPNAYTYAPSAVSAVLAATATKVMVYVLLRFIFGIIGVQFSFGVLHLNQILLVLALLGVISASLVAINQTNVKRMLAYSSVAQLAYMILGVAMASVTGLTATLLHLFNHALMKGALFLAMGAIVYRIGASDVASMRGIGRRMPWTMAAFVIAGLSLIGMPLTVGFVSKWYLILGALQLGWWPVVGVILGGSLLALVYIWRIVEIAYFQPNEDGVREEAPLALLLPMWLLVIANLYFGIDTRLTIGAAESAARVLMGSGP
jgi:multicomponent Na+:H+ antiporter subunit D